MKRNLPPPQRIADMTQEQLRQIAPHAKTTANSLRQYQNGSRTMSSALAIRVEKGARKVGINLPRELNARGCSACEFARYCRREGIK